MRCTTTGMSLSEQQLLRSLSKASVAQDLI